MDPSPQRLIARLGCAAALAAAATLGQAQTVLPKLKAVPQPAAPAMGSNGLGMPNPSGLNSQFPAGLPSPIANPAGLPPVTVPNLASPGTPAGSPAIDAGIAAPPLNAMGAGTYPAPGRPSGTVVLSGPLTAMQIAGSFIGADLNRDGELTRAEAQRLTIAPYSFEEMDRNHDGILTRSEYEDALR